MLQELLLPALSAFLTGFGTWFFARSKNRADLRSQFTDNEIKASVYYQGLLDDMARRLDSAINELMLSEERHRSLMELNRQLVIELQKFKQLNGKS